MEVRRWALVIGCGLCVSLGGCGKDPFVGNYEGQTNGTYVEITPTMPGQGKVGSSNFNLDWSMAIDKREKGHYSIRLGPCALEADGETSGSPSLSTASSKSCDVSAAGRAVRLSDPRGVITIDRDGAAQVTFTASGPKSSDGSLPQFTATFVGKRKN